MAQRNEYDSEREKHSEELKQGLRHRFMATKPKPMMR